MARDYSLGMARLGWIYQSTPYLEPATPNKAAMVFLCPREINKSYIVFVNLISSHVQKNDGLNLTEDICWIGHITHASYVQLIIKAIAFAPESDLLWFETPILLLMDLYTFVHDDLIPHTYFQLPLPMFYCSLVLKPPQYCIHALAIAILKLIQSCKLWFETPHNNNRFVNLYSKPPKLILILIQYCLNQSPSYTNAYLH